MVRLGLLVAAALLSGCVDLEAVRRYADDSEAVMDSVRPVLAGDDDDADLVHARQVARSPLLRKAAPDDSASIERDAADLEDTGPLAKQASRTLELYFHALADAAGTGIVDVSAQAGSIDRSLVQMKAIGGKGRAAAGSAGALVKLLKIPLDLARQEAVRRLVTSADPDVQVLTGFLREAAKQRAEVAVDAGHVLGAYYGASAAGSRDPGTQALVRARGWEQEADAGRSARAAEQAAAALEAIGRDHAVLARNAEALSGPAVVNALDEDQALMAAAVKPFLSR